MTRHLASGAGRPHSGIAHILRKALLRFVILPPAFVEELGVGPVIAGALEGTVTDSHEAVDVEVTLRAVVVGHGRAAHVCTDQGAVDGVYEEGDRLRSVDPTATVLGFYL